MKFDETTCEDYFLIFEFQKIFEFWKILNWKILKFWMFESHEPMYS